MKARLITLATASVLALPVVAQAEGEGASWYGSIRTSLGYLDVSADASAGSVQASAENDSLNVNDHSSRIGVKGANDLGNGLKVPYRFEFKADSDAAEGIESGRLGRVGLQGGFGAVHIGQLWGPYYTYVAQYTDIFNSVGATYFGGKDHFRLSNSLRYDMPSSGGFSGQIALTADGPDGEDTIDAFNVGIGYNTDAFGVALGYIGDRVDDDADYLGITVGTSFAGFDIGVMYEDFDGADDGEVHAVISYGAGSNTYRVGFADAGSLNAIQAAWQHKLGKASRVAIEVEKADVIETVVNADGLDIDVDAEATKLNFFIRTDF